MKIPSFHLNKSTYGFAVVALGFLTFVACGDDKPPTAPSAATAATTTRIIGLSGSLAFGDVAVGSSVTADLAVTNSGNSALTVSSLTPGGLSSVTSLNWGGGTIAPGASQTVTIQFAPSAAQGFTGVLSVASDATGGTSTISISGTGLAVTPTALPFLFLLSGERPFPQYLGVFACITCLEENPESINNFFNLYSSQFSPKSIRNRFSLYGSPSSDFSACNPFAKQPPIAYGENDDAYGELTLNQSREYAINTPEVIEWLRTNVCRHQ